jgi:hypothetical protein
MSAKFERTLQSHGEEKILKLRPRKKGRRMQPSNHMVNGVPPVPGAGEEAEALSSTASSMHMPSMPDVADKTGDRGKYSC